MAQAYLDHIREEEMKASLEMKSTEKSDIQNLLDSFLPPGSQLNQDFFQDDKEPFKKKSTYSNTKVKARNLLTNSAYTRFSRDDLKKDSFVIDIITFLMQNLNVLGLDRKLDDETERNHIKMIWDECLPREFTSFTLQKENFIQLSGLTVTYQKALELVKNFLDLSENHLALLKQSLEKYFDEIRYIYSTYFPKIYNRTNKVGIKNKTVFEFTYTTWLNKKRDKKKATA